MRVQDSSEVPTTAGGLHGSTIDGSTVEIYDEEVASVRRSDDERSVRPATQSETSSPNVVRRKRVAVVRHAEYYRNHPRRDMYALRDAGFEVDFICDAEPGVPRVENVDGIRVIRLPVRHRRGGPLRYLFEYSAFPLLAALTLAVLSVGRRYDYVEIDTMPTWLIVAAAVPKLLGARVVLYMFEHMAELLASDHGLTEQHWLFRTLDAVELACCRAADTVLTPAERNRERYIAKGISADKIVFIPNCPDENMFLPSGLLSDRAGTDGTEHKPFRVVTHGSLLERYGIHVLLHATYRLKDSIPDLKVDIIGSGEYEPELQRLATSLGIGDIVNFVGPIPFEQIAAAIAGSDVGIAAHLLDLLPNKVMEYFLLGIPVVASDWPTLRRYFDDDSVTYVPPDDAAALADALQHFSDNPASRIAQAGRAHELYLSTLAWSRTRADYLSVYGIDSDDSGEPERQEDATETMAATEPMSWLRFVLGSSRGPRNALNRLPTILARFGLSSARSRRHLNALLSVTERYSVTPTLLVTAVTAKRHPKLLRELQQRGVEIGAHGLVHTDYSALTKAEQDVQVLRAREDIISLGLRPVGWRCPYSRFNAHTMNAIRSAGFEYDSTQVFEWAAFSESGASFSAEARSDYERLRRLFGVQSAAERAVLPRLDHGLVRIPMSIPQDEDMVDRLGLSETDRIRVWLWMLHESRRLRETFVMCLHPERANLMSAALDATLREARSFGDVWIAPLRDIAHWWKERAGADVSVDPVRDGVWAVEVSASDRVVVSYGGESVIGAGRFEIASDRKPVVRTPEVWTNEAKARIQECGYPVEADGFDPYELLPDENPHDSTHPEALVRKLDRIERLVRIEPWPAGFRSCLSVTGDIDALTLIDFALRLKEFR